MSDTSVDYLVKRRVEFRDTDAAGIMHFSTFFTYMEEVEHEFLRSRGLSVVLPDRDSDESQEGAKISWPRVAAKCDYQRAAKFEEILVIEISIKNIGRTSITYQFQFFAENEGDRKADQKEQKGGAEERPLLATGELTAVCCRILPGKRPQKITIPKEFREKLLGN
ncbi:MAG: acyl-CoA thioesterase [Pirellulaceae bacterium]|nr:acyl-CoA thioesterase [Pirellulaceae bacterium]